MLHNLERKNIPLRHKNLGNVPKGEIKGSVNSKVETLNVARNSSRLEDWEHSGPWQRRTKKLTKKGKECECELGGNIKIGSMVYKKT